MSKISTNHIRIGLLFLPLFFALLDIYVSFNSVYSIAFSKFVVLSFSQILYWLLVCLMFVVVSFLTCQFFSVKWFNSSLHTRMVAIKSVVSINRLLNIVFLGICIYKSAEILNFGIFNFFSQARFGETSIGPALYFVLIMFPINLAYELGERGFSWSNIASLALLIILNLITGFRFLLVFGLVFIIIYNWRLVINISKFKLSLVAAVCVIFLGGYEMLRQDLLSGVTDESPSVIERLNRTSPINTLQLIDTNAVSLATTDVIRLWSTPIQVLLVTIGFNFEDSTDSNFNFNMNKVSEPLFSSYLGWRGTPNSDATGFSISIISYSYLFMQELGVFIFAVFYGFFVAVGCKFLASDRYEKKMIGSTLLVGCFMCNESVTEASKLLFYNLIFIAFIFFLFFLRRTIINIQISSKVSRGAY